MTSTTTTKLKSGARVRVYEKPLTGEQEEGIAILIRQCGPHGTSGPERKLYVWNVRFEGEDGVYKRIVSPDDLC